MRNHCKTNDHWTYSSSKFGTYLKFTTLTSLGIKPKNIRFSGEYLTIRINELRIHWCCFNFGLWYRETIKSFTLDISQIHHRFLLGIQEHVEVIHQWVNYYSLFNEISWRLSYLARCIHHKLILVDLPLKTILSWNNCSMLSGFTMVHQLKMIYEKYKRKIKPVCT